MWARAYIRRRPIVTIAGAVALVSLRIEYPL